MTKQSRAIKGEVEGTLSNVLNQGRKAGLGIFGLILFAILREGWLYRSNHADLPLTYPEAFAAQRFQAKLRSS